MNRIVVKSRVGNDGILHLNLPIGETGADQDVQVTVEPLPPATMSAEEWRQFILSTAGKWQGEFERPHQGDYEQREPLS